MQQAKEEDRRVGDPDWKASKRKQKSLTLKYNCARRKSEVRGENSDCEVRGKCGQPHWHADRFMEVPSIETS